MGPPKPLLLVVDDEASVLDLIRRVAESEGFDVQTCHDGREALRLADEHQPTLILVDLRMPKVGGLEVVRALRDRDSKSLIVLMSGYASIDSAVEAVKLGASDYLTKPFDLSRLKETVARVRDEAARRVQILANDREVARRLEFAGMIGRSVGMQQVFECIRRIAPHARTALVTGETGTGKELVARALHHCGPRKPRRFVPINCSAIVEALFESELFGHVRGAFTGASDAKAGLFEVADGGTLFLDEIGEMPLSVQAKLLRVLETGEVQRVGSTQSIRTDVRVIAATNRDLVAEVEAKRFRQDLLYRLNVVQLALPPLRERREDIPYLTAAFVREFSERFGKRIEGLSLSAERLVAEASWPGNVRQLRNVLERACMLADAPVVSEQQIDAGIRATTVGAKPTTTRPVELDQASPADLNAVERHHIVKAMAESGGNKVVAARRLGLSRRALYRRLERHGLERTITRRLAHSGS